MITIKQMICSLMLVALIHPGSYGQTDTLWSWTDELPTLEISAYSRRSDLVRIPAALQVIQDTLRIDPSFSFASSLNQAPGVRLEERSPGSYRLSIRGSTLRSPFGVRNVKVYLDGFSLTDGGGNTYLQLLNPDLIQKTELLKGPASSLYGAGTGGALLFSTQTTKNHIQVGLGSYGRWQESVQLVKALNKWKLQFFQSRQVGDGYREQSALRRDLVFASQQYHTDKSTLHLFQWYGDLHYETPGGLTFEQQQANPRQARPAAGRIPGAVEQHAGIYNKTIMVGAGYQYELNPQWTIDPKVQVWYTDFRNPFITNFENRFEQNFSLRPEIKYFKVLSRGQLEWTNGLEYLDQSGLIKNFGNKKGVRDTLQSATKVFSHQSNVFTQLQWNYDRWQVLSGISINQQVFKYKNRTDVDAQRKESGPVWMPRVSLSYSLQKNMSVFLSAARGYSPPSVAEIRPSSGEYNQELLPESGWNYELGYKLYADKFDFSINLYSLRLQQAIVRRNDAAGVEYFINSGGAAMRGIESWLRYKWNNLTLSASGAWQPYTFKDYKQRNADFSGLAVTGVPETTISGKLDYAIAHRVYLGVGWYTQSELPLNDANTTLLPGYDLWNAYCRWDLGRHLQFTLSGDNLFNEAYSPGPDINAAANRYFNPGPQRSILAGIKYTW